MATPTSEQLSPELERCLNLLCAFFAETDEARSATLLEASGRAFVEVARENWGRRLRAAEALNDQAGCYLDQAEATRDPQERKRLMGLFETCLASAQARI